MNKKEIIKDMITSEDYIRTRDISELTKRFQSGNVTTNDIYRVYGEHQQERVDYLTQELIEGLEITKKYDGEEITFDAGDYIEKAIEDGKTINHCVKYLKIPNKTINSYLEYLGYETTNNTKGKISELINELKVEREKSRDIYFKLMNDEYKDIINKEKDIKEKIIATLSNTQNRKKQSQDGIVITANKEYNKKSFTSQQIVEKIGEQQAKELFGIEPTTEWKYKITTTQFDKNLKGNQ